MEDAEVAGAHPVRNSFIRHSRKVLLGSGVGRQATFELSCSLSLSPYRFTIGKSSVYFRGGLKDNGNCLK